MNFFINLDNIKRIYGTPDEDMHYHYHEKDPMDHFSQKNIERLYKLHYDREKKQTREKQIKGKKKKVCRNDPCPVNLGRNIRNVL